MKVKLRPVKSLRKSTVKKAHMKPMSMKKAKKILKKQKADDEDSEEA